MHVIQWLFGFGPTTVSQVATVALSRGARTLLTAMSVSQLILRMSLVPARAGRVATAGARVQKAAKIALAPGKGILTLPAGLGRSPVLQFGRTVLSHARRRRVARQSSKNSGFGFGTEQEFSIVMVAIV
jgi:hypothetical protein